MINSNSRYILYNYYIIIHHCVTLFIYSMLLDLGRNGEVGEDLPRSFGVDVFKNIVPGKSARDTIIDGSLYLFSPSYRTRARVIYVHSVRTSTSIGLVAYI